MNPEKPYQSEHEFSDQELKTILSKFTKLPLHHREEMLQHFESDDWVKRQIFYLAKLIDQEEWSAVKLLAKALKNEWKKRKIDMGYKDLKITKDL